ncbi:nucleotide-diphospho-sugar transferase [Pedobacter sandarakinus]|uniref:nucleotide-diphospho-sugar transferase n=1 Tax=Pedobacter sandarakinus TaxID=353156 RepID=UPI002245219D|nr:nucleotide-diphospho-sugar transferase [Pedobacter sandarakinus]MCX2575927.1 nucleotide-diphospho-sugar transferase [Pedobacter sandarakinus]
MYQTPILFLIFNRPNQTKKVFDEIKKRKPKYLCIAADGPRVDKLDEISLCNKCREIAQQIDWDCKVDLLFRAENLGCKKAVSTAIDWFFGLYEEGVILEDDCLPNESFFLFAASLLKTYQHAPNVMMISGSSFQNRPLDRYSYYFSKYVHVWGWATWKRAWKHYSVDLDGDHRDVQHHVIDKTFKSAKEREAWKYNLSLIPMGLDTWDYQWMYSIWKHNGLTIIPWKNLISNIGFGANATHTFDGDSNQANMLQHHLETIDHPAQIRVHAHAESVERYKIIIDPAYKMIFQKFINLKHKISKLLLR